MRFIFLFFFIVARATVWSIAAAGGVRAGTPGTPGTAPQPQPNQLQQLQEVNQLQHVQPMEATFKKLT